MKGLFDPLRGYNHRLRTAVLGFFFPIFVFQNLSCSIGKAKEQDSGLSVSNDIQMDGCVP